jgi:hypothetical protein
MSRIFPNFDADPTHCLATGNLILRREPDEEEDEEEEGDKDDKDNADDDGYSE